MLAARLELRDIAESYMNYKSIIVTKSKDSVEKLRSYGFEVTNSLIRESEYIYTYEFNHPTLYAIAEIIVANDFYRKKEFGRKKDAENYMMSSKLRINLVKILANHVLPKELAKVVADYIGCNRKHHFTIKVDSLENIRQKNPGIFSDILHHYVTNVKTHPRQPDSDKLIETITKYCEYDPNYRHIRSQCIAEGVGLELSNDEIDFTVEGLKRLRALIEEEIEAKRQKKSEVEITGSGKSDKEISE